MNLTLTLKHMDALAYFLDKQRRGYDSRSSVLRNRITTQRFTSGVAWKDRATRVTPTSCTIECSEEEWRYLIRCTISHEPATPGEKIKQAELLAALNEYALPAAVDAALDEPSAEAER